MSLRVGIISDPHAHPAPLKEALTLFKQQQVERVLCPGDIAGYGESLDETVALLVDNHCQSVLGNHEIWYLEKLADSQTTVASRYFKPLPRTIQFTAEGKKLFMVHASPPDSCMNGIRLLDPGGEVNQQQQHFWSEQLAQFEHDVLIVGHTHQVFAEQLGRPLVINPGSTCYNHSCAILTLPEMAVEFFPLSNKTINKTWNWGMNQPNTSPYNQ